MKRLYLGAIAAAVALWACQGDPTASLRGGPFQLRVTPDVMFISEGDARTVEVLATDEQLNPLPLSVTGTSGDEAIFTVEADTLPPTNNVRSRFFVSALDPGQATLTLQGGGLSKGATINVLPVAFAGAISSLTPAGGDTLVLRSTALLKFDPDTLAVAFGDGVPGTVIGATADTAAILVPFAAAGPLAITGVAVTYVTDLVVTLPSADDVAPTGDVWSGDDAVATAPALPLPGSGESTYVLTNTTSVDNSASCPEVVLGFGSSGPCMIYSFVLAQDTEVNFHVDWDGDADVDIYVCPDADPGNCYEDGGGGATGNHPEETGAVFSAGTHYLFIEVYDGSPPDNIYVTISQP